MRGEMVMMMKTIQSYAFLPKTKKKIALRDTAEKKRKSEQLKKVG